MSKFISKKEKKYNVDDIANQLISQIKNNEVDSNKINIQEIADTNINNNNSYNENNNVNNISIWDRVKSLANDLGYIAKKTGAGAVTGTTGIAQGQLTDVANSLKNGKEKSKAELTANFIRNLQGLTNPMQAYNNILKSAPQNILNTIKTISDKDKNTIEKITSIATNATSNAMNNTSAKKFIDSGLQIAGKLNPNLDENILELNNKISNPVNKMNEGLEEESKNYGAITNTLANAGQSIGNMTPSILATAITKNPNMGLATMGLSVKGQATQEALNKGAELNDAVKIGNTKAMVEVGTEMLTGGVNIFGKGALDDIVKRGVLDKVKNNVAKSITKQGLNVAGEILEETISDILGTAIDKGTVNPNAQYSLKDWGDTALTTTLTTLILNSLGIAGDIKNIRNENKVNKNAQYWINEAQNIINNNSTQNLQQNTTQNQINQQMQQVTPVQNGNVSNLNITANDVSKPTIKDFNESAKQYNIDYSNEDLKEINQMFNNRGIKAYFDENTFKNNNDAFSVWKPVIDEQGNISKREVVFNPNAKDSNTRVQELAIHELGHDLDLNEVQDMILNDASRKTNWESARKSLENTYREAYNNDGINISEEDFNKIVNEEATMSILQRELGSQEYVNRLVNQNQSIAKKIYNWVIDKLNKFTGGRNERIFWADIKNKFENAYNQEFNKNDSNIYKKYSIQTDNNGNKYVKVDTDQNIFDGIDKKDYNKIAKMYIQDYLMGKTKLSDNDTAVIDRKSANKYTNPGKKQQNFDKKMQLTPELKNVLEIAQKDSISLPIKSNSKYQNWEYYKFDFELSGKKFNGTVNIGIDSNGNKHFYEINKIKEVDDISGTSLNRSSTSLSNNSLPSTQKNVNSQPLQKYSMQESENNSNIKNSNKSSFSFDEINSKIKTDSNINKLTDKGITMTYVHMNNQNTQYYGTQYGQNIEPSGEYMNVDTMQGKYKIPGAEYGTINFEKPLILDHVNTGETGWKKTLSDMFDGKTGKKLSNAIKKAGYDGIITIDEDGNYSEVVNINGKKINNENKKESKYLLPTKEWQQFIEYNYQKQGTGKNLKEYNLPRKEEVKTKLNLPIKENINKQDNQTTQGEKIDWNEIERPEGKIRKHYRSIIESSNTTKEAKAIAKELMGTDTYVPETNKGQLAQADYRINNSSPEAELKSLMNRVIQGEKVSSIDIAVGERLIQYYSKVGDKTNLQEAIQTTAMAGTSAGQTVQALAMLNHQTPEGQATWIQRSVDKMNNELAKRKGGTITKDEEGNIKVINKQGKDITDKVDLFELTPDMIDKIVSSKNKTEMYDNIDQVYEDLGQQVPLSIMEKIDSWRYFSMLANPKTHIRNMVGNVAMGKTQSLKDKLAGGIEDIIGTFNKDMERTKTLRPADAKTKEFAKNDVLNPDVQSMMELNENKYDPQSRLQNARKTFKNDALENTLGRLFNWNDKLLETEDALGLKSNYKKALANYLTANKIDVDNITDKQLSKARNYAVEQAKEATFHQANSIATAINQFSKKNGLTKGFTDAVLPFVKTPLNVAKAGLEYNPTGLLKTITYDTVKLRKGEITVNKYIDNLSKGLTGTGIAVLGYALADAGILKASGGDDDKKEKYDETLGKQTYSITIGDKTYSLDWLAPVGIPLFVGAEAKAIRDSKKDEKSSISSDDDKKINQAVSSLENLANAMANSMSPMSEMSMISGLTSALKSYEQDSTKMLGTIGTNAVKSYINQFVPTALGQIARTTDDYERSTTSTKTGVLSKAIDQTKLQVMSKIPGLRQKLPTKADIWGNEQKSEPNLPLRIVRNFINPATVKNIDTSKVDEELDNLYNRIGESSILPSTIDKKYTINGQTYRMTNEEYAKYKKNYGQTSYKLLDDLINSNDYNKLSDEQKQKAIENIYSYAKEVNKVDYAKNNNETVKTSTLYDTLEELKQKGGNQSSYLNYIAKTKDITGEGANKKKIGILANSNYSDKTKEIIYKNVEEGSKDKKIILVDKLGLPINEYLKYKSQKFENDKDEDGETISGSRIEKVYDYLNNIPDEDLPEDYKKIILKIEDINDYDNDIVNFVNNSEQLNYDERTEILKDIGFKIDKDGKIQTISRIPIVKYVK